MVVVYKLEKMRTNSRSPTQDNLDALERIMTKSVTY